MFVFISSLVIPQYTYLYILSTHIGAALLFYPLGIVLSLYLVASIYYMIFKLAYDLFTLVKFFNYNFFGVLEDFINLSLGVGYVSYSVVFIYKIIREHVINYSMYLLVFYLKRFEFYIFCFFIIAVYY